MRVLVAPDKFAGTLTAVEAARAIATGWRRHAPDDELDLAPMADGGPGFVDVLHEALGGDVLAVTVSGPFGEPTPATLLVVDGTAYVESAQACGLHLTRRERAEEASHARGGRAACWRRSTRAPARSSSDSAAAARPTAAPASWPPSGPPPTDRSTPDLPASTAWAASTSPPAANGSATSPWSPRATWTTSCTGMFGAAKTFGPQKGVAEERIPVVDGWLEAYATAVDRRTSLLPGAGAAGGLGFALLALGASRRPGLDLVAEATRLAERARAADLVLTGEGAFDFSSRAGKVPYGVAQIAAEAVRPCVALAGQVLVGAREMRALGIESAYSLVDLVGEERAVAEPAEALAELAQRVARTWSH